MLLLFDNRNNVDIKTTNIDIIVNDTTMIENIYIILFIRSPL